MKHRIILLAFFSAIAIGAGDGQKSYTCQLNVGDASTTFEVPFGPCIAAHLSGYSVTVSSDDSCVQINLSHEGESVAVGPAQVSYLDAYLSGADDDAWVHCQLKQ